MKPRIAVVIPCYNHGPFLQEAVDSVLLAKRSDLELVIVDDGSTDPHTQREIGRLSTEGFRVIRQPNSGVMVTRHVGIRATTAEYILPLDADNKVRPAYFERALAILDRDLRVGVVYGDAQKFGMRSGRWVTGAFDREKLMSINFIDTCAVFRRKIWEENGGYDASMPVQGLEDWDFWLGALSHGWEFAYVPEILFDYRIEPGSLSTQSGAKLKAVEEFIAKKYAVLYRQAWIEMQQDLFSLRATSDNLTRLLLRRIRNKFVSVEKREPDRWLHRLKQPR